MGTTNTKMTSLIRFIAACIVAMMTLTAFASGVSANEQEATPLRIGFHLWKPGKIYDEAMTGIRDGLDLQQLVYEEILIESNRDAALAEANFLKMDEMGLDLIYSLSSAGTKIAKRLNLRTPVIATVVNHPASLKIDEVDD